MSGLLSVFPLDEESSLFEVERLRCRLRPFDEKAEADGRVAERQAVGEGEGEGEGEELEVIPP